MRNCPLNVPKLSASDRLNDVLRAFIRFLLELPENYVKPAKQMNKTADAFATVLIYGYEKTSRDGTYYEDVADSTQVEEVLVGVRRVMVSVQFFKGDASGLAFALQSRLRSAKATDWLNAHGIAFVRVGRVNDLSAVIDQSFEQRAQIDITFAVNHIERIRLESIGTVPISINNTHNFEVKA